MKNHMGSNFDDFLEEEGILEECKEEAAKRVLVWQLEREIEKQNMTNMNEKIGVILLAGGTGTRMQTQIGFPPKQMRLLGDKPLLAHSLSLFLQMEEVGQVALVLSSEYVEAIQPWCDERVRIALPGATRYQSMYHGLLALDPSLSLICVHDAARPFITCDQVKAVCDAARDSGAAALAVPVKATITEATEEGHVERTLNRAHLWEMQTPQVTQRSWLLEGYACAQEKSVIPTDDLSLIALIGRPEVPKGVLVRGSDANIKITTAEDFRFAEHYFAEHSNAKPQVSRTGVYGVHIQNGKILLVHKGPHGVYAGRWDLPGGGIEFGESPEEALMREWREEVGMHVKEFHPLTTRSVLIHVPPETSSRKIPFQRFHHLGLLYTIADAEPHPTCIAQDPFAWHALDSLRESQLTPFAYYATESIQAQSRIKSIKTAVE